MKMLRNFSIRGKLVFAALVPLLALFYYLQINIRDELNQREAARRVIEDVSVIEAISKVVHELQKERTLTLTFLASQGEEGREGLLTEQEATDAAVTSLERLQRAISRTFDSQASLDSLGTIRAAVSGLKPIDEVDLYYSRTKRWLLDEIADILQASSSMEMKRRFEEHLFLLYAKDYLAQMRTELGMALVNRRFEGQSVANFAMAKGKHDSNMDRFLNLMSPEISEYFRRKYQGPFVATTYSISDSLLQAPSKIAEYDFDTWWLNSTNSLNALKEVEDYSSAVIKSHADAELAAANRNVLWSLLIALTVALVISYLVWSTIRSIVSSIYMLKGAADKIAAGDADVEVDIRTGDEFGELAESFREIVASSKDFSESAHAIGNGDYSAVIRVRGPADRLGMALEAMKGNLARLSRENELRTWLLTGNTEMNDTIRGDKDVLTLSQDVIVQLCNYLKAQVGAIYLHESGTLTLVGSYAYHDRKDNANVFRLGQGLVGQAALEKKPILFNEVPGDYVRIQSGLGNSVPKSILVFPLVNDGVLACVVELGSAKPFSELELRLLHLVGENVAIAFRSAQSRAKMKELLEETQRQAEELEAQQEELKQSNEGLLEKTNLLERSEAELKAQQEELQQANEELEEKADLLEDQKEKLELAKAEIEDKARELERTGKYKSEFLANMSHELRTPLNSILILSQLLSENKSRLLGDKEVEYAHNIYHSGTDLLHLINEILDLSKVESGRVELDIHEVPLADLRGEVMSMFEEVANNKSIDFSVQIDPAFAGKAVYTDRQRLGQILRNLLSNAFKFTGKGGSVRLHMGKAGSGRALRNPRLQGVRDLVVFSVSDTGIGIAKNKLGVVFEAFQQADGSTKRKYGGTGLGLSISRELAHALGGEIHVESEEGKGSVFHLYLPMRFDASLLTHNERKVDVKTRPAEPVIVPDPTRPSAVESFADLPDDRNSIRDTDKVALIVEDDPEFRQILLDLVRERHYKGIVAAEGNTGLSYARHYKPDAIILDLKLPVMDGAEVLRHLKNDPALRHIPVQIISGYDRRKEGLELGAFDFIQKPITIQDLRKAFDNIEEFVNRKLKKLLIVEDDPTQNTAIRELIGNGDVKCFSAFSGREGYEMMRNDRFDCVIIDLGLPDISGFDLLEKIKGDDELRRVPVIVYTGKDLSKAENAQLMKYASTVVLKTASSHERLLDETMLFLHRVEAKLPKEKQTIIRKLHKSGEVLKGRKILVADDDIRNIYSLTNALEEEGMECLTAENGLVAVQMLREDPSVELVLMDVMMPELDGYEATREIRALDQFRKLPIIALTAKAMKGDREKCLNAGMSDYIAKPVNVEQLLSLMRVWLYR